MNYQANDPRLPERFWNKVNINETTGCWEWQGETPWGYGRFFVRGTGKQFLAHRVSYAALVGPIPAGLQIDHRCRVRSCVNPAHLEAVTGAENMRRSPKVQKMIADSAERERSKTHCPKGHEYTPENTKAAHGDLPGRACRTCAKAANVAHYNKNAERRRAEGRAYHAAHREERKAKMRASYHAKRDERIEKMRVYRTINKTIKKSSD